MKVSFINSFVVVVICALLITIVTAVPGNRWRPSDPRCSGGANSGFRFKRWAGSNKNGGVTSGTSYYKFNGNSGGCEKFFGNPARDYNIFESRSECDRECLNVYHFS